MAHRDKRLHHVFRRFSRDQYCTKHDTPLWDASTASKHREPECIKCAFDRIDMLEAASRNERERWMPLTRRNDDRSYWVWVLIFR
jgi:hypothetical protein